MGESEVGERGESDRDIERRIERTERVGGGRVGARVEIKKS